MGQQLSGFQNRKTVLSSSEIFPEPDYYIEDNILLQRSISQNYDENDHSYAELYESKDNSDYMFDEGEGLDCKLETPYCQIKKEIKRSLKSVHSVSERYFERNSRPLSSGKRDSNFFKLFDDEIKLLSQFTDGDFLKHSDSEVNKEDSIELIELLITEARKEITFRKSLNGSRATLISENSLAQLDSSRPLSKFKGQVTIGSLETLTNLLQKLEYFRESSDQRYPSSGLKCDMVEAGVQKDSSNTPSQFEEKKDIDLLSIDSGVDGCNVSELGSPRGKDLNMEPNNIVMPNAELDEIHSLRLDEVNLDKNKNKIIRDSECLAKIRKLRKNRMILHLFGTSKLREQLKLVHRNVKTNQKQRSVSPNQVKHEFVKSSLPFCYQFWVPSDNDLMKCFNTNVDRRIVAICRQSNCNLTLMPVIRKDACGMNVQEIIVEAPSLDCMERCCSMLDAKFPRFNAGAGLHCMPQRISSGFRDVNLNFIGLLLEHLNDYKSPEM